MLMRCPDGFEVARENLLSSFVQLKLTARHMLSIVNANKQAPKLSRTCFHPWFEADSARRYLYVASIGLKIPSVAGSEVGRLDLAMARLTASDFVRDPAQDTLGTFRSPQPVPE